MIIPCIDLQDGKVVQLVRGETRALALDDLDEVLARFKDFPLIHVIDLDAAMGRGSNGELVARIVKQRPARVGGGVRDLERAQELVDLGAQQVIIGTAAFRQGGINEPLLRSLRDALGVDRICIALDCKGGSVAIRGWKKTLPITPEEVMEQLSPYCSAFLCTFVDNEGTLEGTDVAWYRKLRNLTDHNLIAAGGIGSFEEVRTLNAIGLDVALGMGIYTGKLPIAELACLNRPIVKLDANENPLGPSPLAIRAAQRAAQMMHRYPDSKGTELKAKLAKRAGLEIGNVLLSNGSDEMIHLLGLIALQPEDELLVGDPTFLRYEPTGSLAKARILKSPLDSQGRYDLAAMASLATERTKLVFLANPNAPTGTVICKREFDKFLLDLPPAALVVLDEAYIEYAEGTDGLPRSVDYVKAGRHVVGLRTFSKAYGLAGIRLGYAFAAKEIVDAIEEIRETFNVNATAQAAGLAALSDERHLAASVANAQEGIAYLTKALIDLGATVADSKANSVYAEFPFEIGPVVACLASQGVFVRAFDNPRVMRVSVGTDLEQKRLVEALTSALRA
jgi:histidinol-phosphate aminotransferase/phosphoribosylformimino-5-aminoimidazole carboxamide ribotide isomerase